MIDRVVQKPFLLWQAEAMLQPPAGEPEAPLPEDEPEVSPEEIEAARAAVASALAEERQKPLTPAPPEQQEQAAVRGEEAASIDERSYFPRDPALSIVQSAVERYLMEFAPGDLLTEIPGDDEAREAEDSGYATAVADYVLNVPDGAIPAVQEDDRRLFGAFEITDVRWVSSVVAMGWRKLRGRAELPRDPAEPAALASDARLVVVGDWASGNHRARRVAAQMKEAVAAATDAGRQCHVVHHGDTYYAGWGYEYRKRFLPHWPVDPAQAEAVGSWSLPGNHDMYTGGHGYYEVLLQDPRFARHQGSSRFSLENEHWQLLGLDTSWSDHDLAGDQPDWVAAKLKDNPDRRTMLLSHHQPFSAYNSGGAKLAKALEEPLAGGRIDSWLWGHEHRCAIYDPAHGVAAPRLIGHGGVPVYTPGAKPAGVRWQLDRSYRTGLESWAFCGFAVLDFDGPSVEVEYVNEFGETDETETI